MPLQLQPNDAFAHERYLIKKLNILLEKDELSCLGCEDDYTRGYNQCLQDVRNDIQYILDNLPTE
jgi:hypothetical protein